MSTQIRSIYLADGLVEIVYIDLPADVRANGTLAQSHTLSIDTDNGDYTAEREALEEAALAMLRDALEDFNAPPAVLPMPGE
jgi:hypothetical protein